MHVQIVGDIELGPMDRTAFGRDIPNYCIRVVKPGKARTPRGGTPPAGTCELDALGMDGNDAKSTAELTGQGKGIIVPALASPHFVSTPPRQCAFKKAFSKEQMWESCAKTMSQHVASPSPVPSIPPPAPPPHQSSKEIKTAAGALAGDLATFEADCPKAIDFEGTLREDRYAERTKDGQCEKPSGMWGREYTFSFYCFMEFAARGIYK